MLMGLILSIMTEVSKLCVVGHALAKLFDKGNIDSKAEALQDVVLAYPPSLSSFMLILRLFFNLKSKCHL